MKLSLLLTCLLAGFRCRSSLLIQDTEQVKEVLKSMSDEMVLSDQRIQLAKWMFYSNMSQEYQDKYMKAVNETNIMKRAFWDKINHINLSNADDDIRRQVRFFSEFVDYSVLDEKKCYELEITIRSMEWDYAMAKIPIPNYSNNTMTLAELEEYFASPADPKDLSKAWSDWRDTIANLRKPFQRYVKLMNEAAKIQNYSDAAEMIKSKYEIDDVVQQAKLLWNQVKDFYKELHAYIRHQLKKYYGNVVNEKGAIPIHLLKNLWGQNWNKLFKLTAPSSPVLTEKLETALQEQCYTPLSMCRVADDFMSSLNFTPTHRSFFENSILELTERSLPHRSVFIFDTKDSRAIGQLSCNLADFYQAHWVMFTVHILMQTRAQPFIYQDSPILSLEGAIIGSLLHSVKSRKHFSKIGLLSKTDLNLPGYHINFLYYSALEDMSFLPFGYALEMWRWNVFSGKIKPEDYNCAWWDLRYEYQGVEPSVNRTEKDFDPAGKYHIVANLNYLHHFFHHFLIYQVHRTLCIKSGMYTGNDSVKPLHECDVYGSYEIGKIIKDVLRQGRSKPFKVLLNQFVGADTISAESLLLYYKPLQTWLENYNKKNKVHVGWEEAHTRCIKQQ